MSHFNILQKQFTYFSQRNKFIKHIGNSSKSPCLIYLNLTYINRKFKGEKTPLNIQQTNSQAVTFHLSHLFFLTQTS